MFLMYLARVEFLKAILLVLSPLYVVFLYPNRQLLSPMVMAGRGHEFLISDRKPLH